MLWRYGQHLFRSYGSLRLAQGDLDAALAYADKCLAQPIGNPPQLWRTRATLADARHAEQDQPAAKRAYRQALNIINAVAADLRPPLRQVFLESSHIQSSLRNAELFVGERVTRTTSGHPRDRPPPIRRSRRPA